MLFKQAACLDVSRRGFETDGAFVETAVDVNVSELLALEADFIVMWVIVDKGCIVIAACPLDFSMSDGNLFLLGQGRQRGGGSGDH